MKIKLKTLLFTVFLLPITVYAADGNLKIDTNIQTPTEQRDVSYIEQETELSKLFSPEATKNINKLQDEKTEQYSKDKQALFMKKLTQENLVKQYQTLNK
ncbi:hypothetical protein [Streptococcus gallinaceus]|uniref:hypothetical protein n=1 Tax=Streptococcus gallinaceus TaxID=165758 RepID=UPI0020A58DF5|nr:hypothetical protein [Streptococcus gallinaceus]MCP1770161.1 hypothetical protein [Streptococcus gallinaceus]